MRNFAVSGAIFVVALIAIACFLVSTNSESSSQPLQAQGLPEFHYLNAEGASFALQVDKLVRGSELGQLPGWDGIARNEIRIAVERAYKSPGAQDKFLSESELLMILRLETIGQEAALRGFYDQFNRIEVELVETGPIRSLSWGTYVPFGSACDRADDQPKKEKCVRNNLNNTVRCGGTTYYEGGGGTYESEDGKKIQECEDAKDKTVYVDVRLGDDECDGCTPHGKQGAPAGG